MAVIEQTNDLDIDELDAALEGKRFPDVTESDDGTGDSDSSTDADTDSSDDITVQNAKGTEEDTDSTDKSDDGVGKADEESVGTLTADDHLAEMRQIIRSQKRDIAMLVAKTDRLSKRLTTPVKKEESDSEDDDIDLFGDRKEVKAEEPATEDLSEIEQLSASIRGIGEERGLMLETLLETMKMNPNYQDVDEVCSQRHFDDVFETIGQAVADREGIDPTLAQMRAEAAVWKMANPYRYMYGLIKEHHPAYKKVADEKKTAAPSGTVKEVKKVEAPGSIGNLPPSGKSGAGAWTAARIDEMDELELGNVPPDIYDKYMKGLLD